jgi:hypothetical protein
LDATAEVAVAAGAVVAAGAAGAVVGAGIAVGAAVAALPQAVSAKDASINKLTSDHTNDLLFIFLLFSSREMYLEFGLLFAAY